ncbi:uncharacterized protein LOC143243128 isoform X3 [Tachypleus tridentatus]|uniref:uncharacterized protein LOC143243128 isoform X3 n=1 Tax=Tachypleus tridentatus TaxID=6853 RepID=UPI003FD2E3AA
MSLMYGFCTITRLWNRHQQHGSTRDRPRSGRPRLTTPAQDHYIRLRHLRDRTTTATSTASTVLLHIRGNLTDFAFADFGCSAVTVQSFTHVTQNYPE